MKKTTKVRLIALTMAVLLAVALAPLHTFAVQPGGLFVEPASSFANRNWWTPQHIQFSATVYPFGSPQGVTWSVAGSTLPLSTTHMTTTGLLVIAAHESATQLTVTATATNGIYRQVAVTLQGGGSPSLWCNMCQSLVNPMPGNPGLGTCGHPLLGSGFSNWCATCQNWVNPMPGFPGFGTCGHPLQGSGGGFSNWCATCQNWVNPMPGVPGFGTCGHPLQGGGGTWHPGTNWGAGRIVEGSRTIDVGQTLQLSVDRTGNWGGVGGGDWCFTCNTVASWSCVNLGHHLSWQGGNWGGAGNWCHSCNTVPTATCHAHHPQFVTWGNQWGNQWGATGPVEWTSSNTNVATVGGTTGLVTAQSAGTSVITARWGGGLTDSVTITVNAPLPIEINVSPVSATVETNSSHRFSVVEPGGASPSVTWSISGQASSGTLITTGGLLRVASNETATTITVRATLTANAARYGTATVTVMQAAPPTPITPTVPTLPQVVYNDVPRTAWFHNDVITVSQRSLFEGTTPGAPAGTFNPRGNMTRAMLAQVMANLEGANLAALAGTPSAFGDVSATDWFFGAVNWASDTGFMLGVGEGAFAPNRPVTREEIAVILHRYAQSAGLALPQGNAAPIADRGAISDWALTAVDAMRAAGILSSRDGNFEPQATATRAEAAAIFVRLTNLAR